MQYFVVWPDGQKFGPADVNQLNSWVQEKRINADTELESVESGARLKAKDLPGLSFPVDPIPQFSQPVDPVPQTPVQPVQDPVAPSPSFSGPTTYFVIGAGGQKYGPADAATLTQWASESRLTPTTELEDSSSGQRVLASQVPAIVFPMGVAGGGTTMPADVSNPYAGSAGNQAASPYGASNYQRGSNMSPDYGKQEATNAIIMSAAGLFCCCFLHIGGLIMAYKAKGMGHPMGKTAVIIAWVAFVLSILVFLLQLGPILAAIGSSAGASNF